MVGDVIILNCNKINLNKPVTTWIGFSNDFITCLSLFVTTKVHKVNRAKNA